MLNKLKNKKLLIPLGILFVLFFISIFLLSDGSKKTTPNNLGQYTPYPSSMPGIRESEKFEILSVYPGAGEVEILIPNEAFGFRFSRPIDAQTVGISIKPNIDFTSSYDEQNLVVYIHPKDYWIKDRAYEITISAESDRSEKLEEPYTIVFIPKEVGPEEVDLEPHKEGAPGGI